MSRPTDIYRYFPAIDHEVLKADLRRRITSRNPKTSSNRREGNASECMGAWGPAELAKLVKAYATSTEPQALAITCVTCRREHDIGETLSVGLATAAGR